MTRADIKSVLVWGSIPILTVTLMGGLYLGGRWILKSLCS